MTLEKLTWQERCTKVRQFHIEHVKEDSDWTIEDTAKALRRSFGSVAEDIKLADWIRTHPKVADFKYIKEALGFIRGKTKEMRIRA